MLTRIKNAGNKAVAAGTALVLAVPAFADDTAAYQGLLDKVEAGTPAIVAALVAAGAVILGMILAQKAVKMVLRMLEGQAR